METWSLRIARRGFAVEGSVRSSGCLGWELNQVVAQSAHCQARNGELRTYLMTRITFEDLRQKLQRA